jgi:aspartate kinase
LLEHKKTGEQGIYGLFASMEGKAGQGKWQDAFEALKEQILSINSGLFAAAALESANQFIVSKLDNAFKVLTDLHELCQHGHFSLKDHLQTVREMLASIGEIHSAYNTATLLQQEGVNARFVDLSGWNIDRHLSLDEHIALAFEDVDVMTQMPIVTGYSHTEDGLMASFDRGYSEMTFSRIAVVTGAKEAIIHKEFHLSTADPRLVGESNALPIGRTNYDVADQLANLGMEAIHPKAAKGLRQQGIYLRVKNAFEPDHAGTLITRGYVSEAPRVEIIAGRQNVFAIEVFDQDMVGDGSDYEVALMGIIQRFDAYVVNKDLNANTITHYLAANLKTIERIEEAVQALYEGAEVDIRQVCVVSAIGSHMKIPGMMAKCAQALADVDVSILAIHQSMRQVDMQFILEDADYDKAVKSLHVHLIEAQQ